MTELPKERARVMAQAWVLVHWTVALRMGGGDVDRAVEMLPSEMLKALRDSFDSSSGRERLDDGGRVVDAMSQELDKRNKQDDELAGPAPTSMALEFLAAFSGGATLREATASMTTETLEKVAQFFAREDVSRILASAKDRPAYLPREMKQAADDELRRRGAGTVA